MKTIEKAHRRALGNLTLQNFILSTLDIVLPMLNNAINTKIVKADGKFTKSFNETVIDLISNKLVREKKDDFNISANYYFDYQYSGICLCFSVCLSKEGSEYFDRTVEIAKVINSNLTEINKKENIISAYGFNKSYDVEKILSDIQIYETALKQANELKNKIPFEFQEFINKYI